MLSSLALLTACTHTLEFKDTGDLACGPGTHEEAGLCVPDDAGTTPIGTTTDTTDTTDTTTTGTTGTEPNAPPSAPSIAITPEHPTQLSDLTCAITAPAEDADGDPITYSYAWFVRGVDSGITDPVVPDAATLSDDTWTCQVTASDGRDEGPSAETSVTLIRGYSQVSTGTYHVCGLWPEDRGEAGAVECWGTNLYGEGTPPSGDYTSLNAGYYETCGMDEAGEISCWGTVSWGMNAPPAGAFVSFDLGWYGAYAVDEAGALSMWGNVSELPAGAYTAVAGGEYDYCALDADGLIVCWGANNNGEADAPGGEFTSIDGGYHNFCALDTEGLPACWGFRPEVLDTPSETLTALSAHDGNACGIRPDTSLLCWGDDEALVADTPEGGFTAVSVGWNAACALDSEGHATCWGSMATSPTMR